MAKANKVPQTAALRLLRASSVDFEIAQYDYVPRGGARASAKALGVDLHAVIKTVVMQDSAKKTGLLVLMHGDRAVSARKLGRLLGSKSVAAAEPSMATRYTGYLVGGTSPFGTRKRLPVFAERSIFELERIWINGGKRGLLVALRPSVLTELLDAVPVDVARDNM